VTHLFLKGSHPLPRLQSRGSKYCRARHLPSIYFLSTVEGMARKQSEHLTEEELFLLREARALARSRTARAVRTSAGFSQMQVARVVGVSDAAISRWESGLAIPRGEPAVRWIRLMHKIRTFLAATRAHRYFPCYLLALTTGMRRGELLGLR
jgi:DNA-binding transcriptional regulator YiaG